MSEKDVRYLALGGAAVVITLLVGIATGWNLITLLVGAVLVGSVLALRFFPHLVVGSDPPVVRPQAAQTTPGQLRKVGPVSLETATPEFRMMFSATVLWRPSRRAEPSRIAAVQPPQPRDPLVPAPPATVVRGSDEPSGVADPTSDEPQPVSVPPPPAGEAPAGRLPSGSDPVEEEAAEPLSAEQCRVERSGGGGRAWHGDPGALAADAAREFAAGLVRGSSAADSNSLTLQLAKELGWERADPTGMVRWCAQEVELVPADPDDAERLRTRSRLRKQVHEWDQRREYEKNLREYLGDDVLTTSGSAVVWWLARHLEDDQAVPAAVRLINELSTLSAVAQDRGQPDRADSSLMVPSLTPVGSNGGGVGPQDPAVATRALLERLFPDSDDERMMFARNLASIAERSGRGDYAVRVRRLFGVPDLDAGRPEAGGQPQDD
jgi:hypothetical protein